jgi:hypothetical protein
MASNVMGKNLRKIPEYHARKSLMSVLAEKQAFMIKILAMTREYRGKMNFQLSTLKSKISRHKA